MGVIELRAQRCIHVHIPASYPSREAVEAGSVALGTYQIAALGGQRI
jgi:hypothetical protein